MGSTIQNKCRVASALTWHPPVVPKAVRWSALEDSANGIIRDLLREWARLLKRPTRAEAACHRFLAENAGVFLRRLQDYPVAISKLRLGAEHITDLVLVQNCYSDGAKYHLYELESPQDPLFTKKGTASQALLAAIHQVISWKTWLRAHAGEARRLFPSLLHGTDVEAVFSFTIIIGRRDKDPELIRRRRELAASLGIAIRSFDSLADGIQTRPFDDYLNPISGDCHPSLTMTDRSELVNPFHRAFTDPEWRELIHRIWDVGHFYYAVGTRYRLLAQSSRHLAAFRRWARKHGEVGRSRR